MSLAPAKAICLDVDGTLYRVRRLKVAWRLRNQRGLLVAMMAARERIRGEDPLASPEELDTRIAGLVAPSVGLTPPQAEEQLHALRARLPAALTRGHRPFGRVRGALEAALARGLGLCVLSDYPAREKLQWLGLDDLPFQFVGTAEASGALKPHPEAFLPVVRATQLAAHEIVYVGDREDIDVVGAQGAGLRVWKFDPKNGSSSAERVFSKWSLDLFTDLAPASSP